MEGCKPEDGCWVSVVDVLWSMDVVCAGPAVFVFWGWLVPQWGALCALWAFLLLPLSFSRSFFLPSCAFFLPFWCSNNHRRYRRMNRI